MSDYLAAIRQLREHARMTGPGPTRIGLLEEAVRLADSHGNLDEGYRLRNLLMEAASFGGRPDILLVTFSWCLAQHDQSPGRFGNEFNLLWQYKWVVSNLDDFPEISRPQIEAALDDMEQRFRRAGSTMHGVYQKRRSVMMSLGDMDAAARAHAELGRTQRDRLSDCFACAPDLDAGYLIALRRDEEALAAVQPIFQRRLQCAEVPTRTHSKVLLPLLRLGRVQEAMSHHRRGYPQAASNPGHLVTVSRHLRFLVLTDNLTKGLRLFERHLPDALAAPSRADCFTFLLPCRLLFEELLERGKTTIRLRLPPKCSWRTESGRYAVAELIEQINRDLYDLAARFDARNGNRCYADNIAELAELKKLRCPCPLTARRRPAKDEEHHDEAV
jgi:hypothetical protein